MKIVLQRVESAFVKILDKIVGEIEEGLVVFLGISVNDTEKEADFLVEKVANLRIFEDESGKMNKSVLDIKGNILLISQFTLYGDCKKGRRPGFELAAKPDKAEPLYRYFISKLQNYFSDLQTGEFGAEMKISLINNGPVTIILER